MVLVFRCSAQDSGGSYLFTTLAGNPEAGSSDGLGSGARFHLGLRSGVASDGKGAVYVADTLNHSIRCILPTGEVITVAGLAGVPGTADGAGSVARFNRPSGVAVGPTGDVFVSDTGNLRIRRVTPTGVVTTLPGSYFSSGVAVDSGGNIFVAEFDTARVSKLTPEGKVLAQINGFSGPTGVAVNSFGTLYITDYNAHTIEQVTTAGVRSTLAGSPGSQGKVDGSGSAARFTWPSSLSLDGLGNVYVVDEYLHTLRRVTPDGVVTTVAGLAENPGAADGLGREGRFNAPTGVAVDDLNIYVADSENNLIRTVTRGGSVKTLAGVPRPSNSNSVDGVGFQASFSKPAGVVVDSRGTVYVLDGSALRKVSPEGAVTTLSGSFGSGLAVDGSDAVYCVTAAGLTRITRDGVRTLVSQSIGMTDLIAVDGGGTVFIARASDRTVRRLGAAGTAEILAGSPNEYGNRDGAGSEARFDTLSSIAVDRSGTVYVAEGSYYYYMVTQLVGPLGNHSIRRVDTNGVVTTLKVGDLYLGDPQGVAVDPAGNVYIADSYNNVAVRVDPAGTVRIIAGHSGAAGNTDGVGDAVVLGYPSGIAVDRDGVVYIADGVSRTPAGGRNGSGGNRTLRKGWPPGAIIPLAAGNPMRGGNHFGFTTMVSPGQRVVIEATADCRNWLPVFTNSGGGIFNFIDPQETGISPRFYRANTR